jgi:hypothetical protein
VSFSLHKWRVQAVLVPTATGLNFANFPCAFASFDVIWSSRTPGMPVYGLSAGSDILY